MDADKVNEILKDAIKKNAALVSLVKYIHWIPGEKKAILDGSFTADELEAIAYHMKNIKLKGERK